MSYNRSASAARLLRGDYWPASVSPRAFALNRFASDARALRAAGSKLADDADNAARWIASEIIGAGAESGPTKCGPRPLFPMDPVQVIRSTGGAWFVSINGDNGIGPFRTREAADRYAAGCQS